MGIPLPRIISNNYGIPFLMSLKWLKENGQIKLYLDKDSSFLKNYFLINVLPTLLPSELDIELSSFFWSNPTMFNEEEKELFSLIISPNKKNDESLKTETLRTIPYSGYFRFKRFIDQYDFQISVMTSFSYVGPIIKIIDFYKKELDLKECEELNSIKNYYRISKIVSDESLISKRMFNTFEDWFIQIFFSNIKKKFELDIKNVLEKILNQIFEEVIQLINDCHLPHG